MASIHEGNIKIWLATLTINELKKKLSDLEGLYSKPQMRYMSEQTLKDHDKYIELVETEIEKREA